MPKKFKAYFVIDAPIMIQIGQQVKLSEDQYKRRKHLVKQLKKGGDIFECIIPFHFKSGEIFGFEGSFNKKLANRMIDPETIEPEKEPKEDVKDFDSLEILKAMSIHQLQYYARVKCDGLKLSLKMPKDIMIHEIQEYWKPIIAAEKEAAEKEAAEKEKPKPNLNFDNLHEENEQDLKKLSKEKLIKYAFENCDKLILANKMPQSKMITSILDFKNKKQNA